MSKIKFQCSQCGACCRRAGKTGKVPDRGDGACVYLTEDNKCSIYETRPIICRVNKMYDKRKKEGLIQIGVSRKDYYKMNNEICNKWIKEDGLNDVYLIDVTKYDKN